MRITILAFCMLAFLCARTQVNACFNQPSKFNYTIGAQPQDLIHADFDGDGKMDILAFNGTQAFLFYGTTVNFVTTPIVSNLQVIHYWKKAADFNGDGRLDLVAGATSSGVVRIYTMSAGGQLSISNTFTLINGSQATDVQTGDFNGDNLPDVRVPNNNGPGALLLLNNGSGGFSSVYAAPIFPGRVFDVNADGHDDVVIVDAVPNINVYLCNGTGGFGSVITSSAAAGMVQSYTMALIDNNNVPDILLGGNMPDQVVVMYGTGTGSFSAGPSGDHLMGISVQVHVLDWNADGLPDLMASGGFGAQVYYNLGSNQYSQPVIVEPYGSPIGDVNGDLFPDMQLAYSGGFQILWNKPYQFAGGKMSTAITIADVDNDNVNEIINAVENIVVSKNLGGYFHPVQTYSTALSWGTDIKTADLNNDGALDLIRTGQGPNRLDILLSTGTGSFGAPLTTTLTDVPVLVETGDFNNDGNQDLVVLAYLFSSNKVHVFQGNGAGGMALANTINSNSITIWSVQVADFNTNGNADLLVSGVGNAVWFSGNGSGGFSGPTALPYGGGKMLVSDFNGDGHSDYAAMASSGVNIVHGNGAGSFSVAANYGPMTTTQMLDFKHIDLDLDGLKDLLVGSTNRYYTLMGQSSGFLGPVHHTTSLNNYNAIDAGLIDTDGFPDIIDGAVTIYRNVSSTITALSTLSFCPGGSVVLSAPPAASSYTWLPQNVSTSSVAVTAAGSYTLLTGDAGCVSASMPVTVTLLPPPVLTVSSTTVCVGTSATLQAGGATSYTWNSGQQTNTVSLFTLTNISPTVFATGANGCTATAVAGISVNASCADVWPGDANSDGIANNVDVLELGLNWSASGAPRVNAGNSWQPMEATNWSGAVSSGKNRCHADCNGDGVVNAADTMAIWNNFNFMHAFRGSGAGVDTLRMYSDQATVGKGQWGSASIILGTVANPASNVNGVAFTVNYDQSVLEVDSLRVEYPASFINSNNLNFKRDFFPNGALYAATTHTVNANATGNGTIATVHFKIASNASKPNLQLSLSAGVKSDATGSFESLATNGSQVQIALVSAVSEHRFRSSAVFPNPTDGHVSISAQKIIKEVTLSTVAGRMIRSFTCASGEVKLDLADLAQGVYFITVAFEDGLIERHRVALQ